MIVLRPGVAPYKRLAESFRRGVTEEPSDAQAEAFLKAPLRGGPQGLLQSIHDARLTDGTSVLLLVDQFEELFRFRRWKRLGKWIEQEQDLADIYCRLAETARLWKEGKAGLWGTPELDIALEWRRRERPTEAWALR